MTTLHGLVTISEFFAGFNLINTGVVNCLIMCQNARKMHHPEAKKSKNVPGGGTAPSPNSTLRRLRCLDTPAFGARPGPHTKILDPPVHHTSSLSNNQSSQWSINYRSNFPEISNPTQNILQTLRTHLFLLHYLLVYAKVLSNASPLSHFNMFFNYFSGQLSSTR